MGGNAEGSDALAKGRLPSPEQALTPGDTLPLSPPIRPLYEAA